MADAKKKCVILESSDGKCFPVPIKVAKMSNIIKTMLEDLGVNMEDDKEEKIPLLEIHSDILKLVIKWAEFHLDDVVESDYEDSTGQERRSDDIKPWDVEFLKVDQSTLYDLICAANYLDIKGLLDICCKTVANMIKGKTAEEIQKHFNIHNDFSEAEKAQIRKENRWCEER